MKTLKKALWLPFAFTLTCAHAFRDDIPSDPVRDCLAASVAASADYRQACALATIEQACATDRASLEDGLARILGVTTGQVQKAVGRHVLGSLEQGDLCARSEGERLQVMVASRLPRKVRSESPKEWLMSTLSGPGGEIDHTAVSRAIEQREGIVAMSPGKRGGLPASPAGWTNLAGYTQSAGRINHIQFLDATGNNILAGSDGGGVWRTSDGGTTWAPVNDFLGSLSITNFAMASNDANTIYAATNQSGSHTYFPFGIVKSVNAGAAFTQLAQTNPSTNADFTYVNRVAVHPTNASIVIAATNGGAYHSFDGGTVWTKIGGLSTRANYVAFHPTNANLRAVAYHDGTIRYTTTGDLLNAASTVTVLAGGTYMKLAYAKSDMNRMYALVTDPATSVTRLRMSVTGGATWTDVPALPSTITFNSSYLSYTGGLWVDPLNANRVAICEGWAGFTIDVTAVAPVWKRLYSGWVDFHGIVEHPGYNGTSNRTVFFMDDGGLYRVTDVDILDTNPVPGTQFTRLDAGMAVTQVYSVSGHGGNTILGAQDVAPKVYKTDPAVSDATTKWRFTKRPATDATCPNCSWIGDGATTAASTANPLALYGSRQYLDMIRSTDGGATAVSIVSGSALNEGGGVTPTSNTNAGFIAPFVLDPSNQNRMLAGGRSMWRANDVETATPPTWTAIRAPYTETACGASYVSTISVIAIAPSNPDIVWIAHSCAGRVFKSINATAVSPTWTEVATLPAAANLRSKASILIDRVNPNIVWVGVGQYTTSTLFKTTDGGATAGAWTTIAGLPGAPVNAMLQHPANALWIYAATGVGLFASEDGGTTWSASNEGPANVVVKSLDWNTTGTASELLVGTFGRGVWKASVAVAAVADPPRLANISTRMQVLTGNDVMIGGFVIGGATPKTVVVRARGPSLVPFGITNALANPTLQLFSGSTVIASNDDWGSASNAAAITASGFAPGVALESAIYTTLSPGAYTAIVSGVGNTTGVGIVEVFEVDHPEIPLSNISTRGQVLTGNDVMIGGFVIQGSGPQTVVVRARGPSLIPFGITNALANPTLQLFSGSTLLASNDDWQTASNAAAITASGFAPSNALESAILITLNPGAYTAIVSGAGGGTGVGIVEVFAQ